ncbi:GNAT family N-acetyltransferase [Microbacterium sp. LRZ72]|uniref:GNAT family N-acetyltransferase n=1 Tax=Microbacterium sp. LRZ72 TaxID=2942481 RepID=UPI0029B2D70A|nr:GNAT family N-acetyltransferase [Microbacterium sp. LRZ72]MDX2377077.1 GNAT family N-acetyltransferase [Microbacterium sp. LRZ72]
MSTNEAKHHPLDPTSTQTLAERGLEYRAIDTSDVRVFAAFAQSEARGFLEAEQSPERTREFVDAVAYRRLTGVYDPASAAPDSPVGTIDSWVAQLSLPGRRTTPMWAISGVTVAATHRRRGIARAMLEGELRAAVSAGLPLAGLTATEATIYGRFGFAPAAFATHWSIDVHRVRWAGPATTGRLDFVDRPRAADELAALHERVRLHHPGQIDAWPGRWRELTGTAGGAEGGQKIRAVRSANADGVTEGVALYRLVEDSRDYSRHTLELICMITATRAAYATLWRFVLEHDLVSRVEAPLWAIDEPVRWMIADQRAATVTTLDHEWLRVLDVPAVLTARAYAAPVAVVIEVSDEFGFAAGRWRLETDAAGHAEVTATAAEPDVVLPVSSLSSLVLGGVRAATLRDAGRLHAERHVASMIDAAFVAPDVPYLAIWY